MSQQASHPPPATITPTTQDLLAERLSAMRTAFIQERVAIMTRTITRFQRLHAEVCFDITMVRHSLVRAGYDLQARAPRAEVDMTANMRGEGARLQVCLSVILDCRTMMAGVNFQRGELLWREREDVVNEGWRRI
ncbi:uncharacterized protein LAJ45_03710 [Morchella importuna]|uniref:uncharacterized protein n=1 Tax=Morchella importuna TaxID=1174673 RepID=UPI001E8E41B1|nr:uncharacterized protein LAJ45_03710 [Morchella importuna]KAH8152283.1 hypothetical protein LAJ45_03710 [Morchella importuna]